MECLVEFERLPTKCNVEVLLLLMGLKLPESELSSGSEIFLIGWI
jgi:hypothetical protein